MIRPLSTPDAVIAAAAALDTEPEGLLASAELGVLVGILGRARRANDVADGAAELLVGIAASRPFPHSNRVAAWTLAAHLVAVNGWHLVMEPEAAVELVDAASCGALAEGEVAPLLAAAMKRRAGRLRRAAAWCGEPSSAVPASSLWSCPVCSRPVAVPPGRSSVFLADPHARDVVRDCSAQHRAHRDDGRQADATDDDGIDALRTRLVIRHAVPTRA